MNCATFCPPGFSQLKREVEKFEDSKFSQKAKSFFEKTGILEKISSIPSLKEKLENLKNLGQDYLQVDLEKEKIFSEEFKELVTNVILIETKNRLIMLDTGIGKKQISSKNDSLRNIMSGFLTGLKYDESETAHEQIKKLGFSPTDVSDVILTHMDIDHVGGLSDFPQARAHLFQAELDSANNPSTTYEKKRFMTELWQSHKDFCLYQNKGDDFHGFHLTPLKDIQEELYLLDLFGHTKGQAGLFIKEKNTVFAGDSFINQIQMEEDYSPLSIRFYKKMTTTDEAGLNRTLNGLKKLCAEGIHVCCSHDKNHFLAMKDYLEAEV